MRVMAEDRRQVETVIDGTKYRARDGYFDFGDNARHAAAHLRSGNLPSPNLLGASGGGYTCLNGHRNFFARCGRCEETEG